ncbi:MAG: aldo/keto reductase [Candidatus Zixiibacteriota bacterium]
MERRRLGTSDLELPVVTLGTWAIGGTSWGGADDDAAVEAIHAAIDHGVSAIDTAPIYGFGHSEEVVGRAIRGRRHQVEILTKCGLRWDTDEGEFVMESKTLDGLPVSIYKNLTADSIIHECENSLKRLGIDVIDLYQVHWPSTSAPADETMGALVRLKEQGKIREIGVSNYSSAQLEEARSYAPIFSNQIEYSLLSREIENDELPYCRNNDLAILVYSPMHLGLLTGKVTMDRKFPKNDLRHKLPWFQPENRRRVLEAITTLRDIAEARQATISQVAVAWTLHQPGVASALVGARNRAQAIENAGAGLIRLLPQDISALTTTFDRLTLDSSTS